MKKNLASRINICVWVSATVVVLAIGLFYFPREYQDAGFWKTLYFTLRLFVFEHDAEHFPQIWPLILIYFLAPLITLSAVGTAISYMVSMSPALKTKWMSDHVIVCGVGRTGKLFASELKKNKIPVVGIDRGPREAFEEWCEENNVMIVYGDFHSHSLLKKAGAIKARSLIFASGDDLTNLEGAMSAYELMRTEKGPVRLIWVQIANEQLAETARFFVRTRGRVGIRFFDTYRIASARMVAKHFNKERRKGVREINILGFGKFGRDLFEVMVRDLFDGEKYSFRIVDINDRREEIYALARELNVDSWVTFRQIAIQQMKLVDNVDKAFFVCTDDDLGNLTAAMLLARKKNANNIYVRIAYWPMSAVASRLCENRDMYFVNINSLLLEEIRELPGIFEPAEEEDLKRINGGPGRTLTPH